MVRNAQKNCTMHHTDHTGPRWLAALSLLVGNPLTQCSRLENHAAPQVENSDESLTSLDVRGIVPAGLRAVHDPENSADTFALPVSSSLSASGWRMLWSSIYFRDRKTGIVPSACCTMRK
jgi:hypothetical protein